MSSRTAAVTLAAATLMCLPAPGAAAHAKPDLGVKGVAGVLATALTGDELALKVKVANFGKAKSKASKATVRVAPETGSPLSEVIGKGKVGPIAPRRSTTVKVNATIPDVALGVWKLVACVPPGAQKNDCKASSPVSVGDGSSWGRIEAARSEGQLDAGQADLYGLYALTGDPRLPSEYRGNGQMPDGAVFGSIVEDWAALSEAERNLLWPYLLQPRYEQSAWAPGGSAMASLRAKRGAAAEDPCESLTPIAGAWSGIPTAHAVFWYQSGSSSAQANAQTLAAEFEAKIWPTLTGAFKTVDDAAAAPCDPAGDSKIDVYLESGPLPRGGEGVAPPVHIGADCGPFPAFVRIKENADRWTLAHEFMHVIQWAYPACDHHPAWVEGTATWAGDFVYKDDQVEHGYSSGLLFPYSSMLDDGTTDYHAWPFWYSVAKQGGSASIKTFIEALGGNNFAGALAALPGGLREAWKRYAVQRWNQTPIGSAGFEVSQAFKQWDSFGTTPARGADTSVLLGGQQERTFEVKTYGPGGLGDPSKDLAPLTTSFSRVTVEDDNVRELRFTNALDGIPGTVVQAFLRLKDGAWRLEDWSDQGEVTFCRDKPSENVTQLIVASSNALGTGGAFGRATHQLTAKDICEPPTYTGTYSGISRFVDNSGFDSVDFTTQFNGTMTLAPYDGPGATGHEWAITGGTLNVSSFDGRIGDCSFEGGGSFQLPAFNQQGAPAMALVGGKYYLNIPWVIYFPSQSLGVTWGGGPDCEDADPEYPIEGAGQYLTLSPNGVTPAEDGTLTVTDVSSDGDPNWEHDGFEFTLTPVG
jgi:hypothetical protein